jgi:hypothetical protein
MYNKAFKRRGIFAGRGRRLAAHTLQHPPESRSNSRTAPHIG